MENIVESRPIAYWDHHTMSGIPPIMTYLKEQGRTVVPCDSLDSISPNATPITILNPSIIENYDYSHIVGCVEHNPGVFFLMFMPVSDEQRQAQEQLRRSNNVVFLNPREERFMEQIKHQLMRAGYFNLEHELNEKGEFIRTVNSLAVKNGFELSQEFLVKSTRDKPNTELSLGYIEKREVLERRLTETSGDRLVMGVVIPYSPKQRWLEQNSVRNWVQLEKPLGRLLVIRHYSLGEQVRTTWNYMDGLTRTTTPEEVIAGLEQRFKHPSATPTILVYTPKDLNEMNEQERDKEELN